MVRYDVKGKSNLTDAFGIDGGGEEGLEGEGGSGRGKWPGGPTILLGGSSVYSWSVVAGGARGISPEAAYPLRREIESRRFRGPSGARLRVRLETIIGRNSIPRALRRIESLRS